MPEDHSSHPGILLSFDLPAECYAADVRAIAARTIQLFGLREWKAVVLTGEIHGHLGIYSTIGAKMGVYARELFEAEGLGGDISVVTYAGSKPPVSCLNDGLQVACGASVGHGLIEVSEDERKWACALFCCSGRKIKLHLREEYEDAVKSDIAAARAAFGLSPGYWSRIRDLAVKYWSTWDRKEIFNSCEPGA